MRNFFIVTNGQKDQNAAFTKEVQAYLVKHGAVCQVQSDEQLKSHWTDIDQIPAQAECVIVLGGDGTLIQAARDVVSREVPLIGVNIGTLGFLAEVEEKNTFSALDALLKDRYEIEERMMLSGAVFYNDGRKEQPELALNDIVISRRGTLRIIEYRIFVNGEHLYTYGADGIIVSTPTGSTGYSLSAGGPIISPKASMIEVTPICPHTLNTRSIILPPEDEIVVEIGPARKLELEYVQVSFDGTGPYKISSGDQVRIQTAKERTKFIKINKDSFLETLRRKMSD